MLNRRPKRRYLLVGHAGQPSDIIASAISRRFEELFGSIAAERAAIRLVKSAGNTTVIKCRLNQLDRVLVAITMTDPAVVTLDLSGSIRRLERRH
ncbi:MAG TPA: Rpp14/Pop5 family protein [Nitrososphaera sp.]|nr:Rpp14/Pop5 family protein [Nitrososphaera sp.]